MFSAKVVFVLGLALTIVSAELRPGGITELSGNELKTAEDQLILSLSKLASGDGPNYTLGKLISATKQIVVGTLYRYKVELVDESKATKQCDVAISLKGKKFGVEVTFDCPEGKVIKKHDA